jgi:hypothetical protein
MNKGLKIIICLAWSVILAGIVFHFAGTWGVESTPLRLLIAVATGAIAAFETGRWLRKK